MKTIKDMKKTISEAEKIAEANNEATGIERPEDKPGKQDGVGRDNAEDSAEALEDNSQMSRLEEAEALNRELTDKYQRALAEYDNFRKRTAKEKASIYSDGAMDIIKQLLPVIDSFERALKTVGEDERETSAFTGMSLIYKQMLQFMETVGMTETAAVGQKFDPELHQALAHVEDPEYGENEIVEELQKGYKLNDRIIRYSMVKVAN